MSNVFYSNKEEIRNRIIRKAQEIWGIDKIYDFDPLVTLMMEVLSNELFNVVNDVHNLENRIYDKISRVLASENLVSPLPAHSIVHFQPSEDSIVLKSDFHLSIKKKLNTVSSLVKEQVVEMDFSPLHEVKLFDGRIKYMLTSQSVFELFPDHKRLIGKLNRQGASSTIWLGIKCYSNNKQKAYQGLSFYFDWLNYTVNWEIYNLLSLSKWYFNNIPIKVYRNRFMGKSQESNDIELFSNKKFLNILSQDVEAYYQSKYLTISDQIDPSLFDSSKHISPIQEYDVAIEDQDIDWFRIDFPAVISDSMLEELNVVLNTFPIVNKRMVEQSKRLESLRNIIPIDTEVKEQMLTIEDMMDKNGNRYSEVPYAGNIHEADVGYYTVRHGAVERLDERSAKDVVDYLFELIREEKAAFSSFNSDFLQNMMEEMDKSITLIQQKVGLKLLEMHEQKNYIIINTKNQNDLMFMRVWLTYAELANGIGVGTTLYLKQNSYLTNENIVLLTKTTGGRARLGRNERVQAFKYGITTADRIVTKNDIINFIRFELGSKVKHIELKSGLVMDNSLQRGFYKTIDIHIEPEVQHGLRNDEWQELINQTLPKLITRSTMDLNFRIILDNVEYV